MAGGVGSRFWPASRESRPKQFLDILGVGQSLIQMTFERAKLLVPTKNILIATNEKYKSLVQEHLPEVLENRILLEPSRNNTAPCIAYATLKIKAWDEDGVFSVLPSDHVILKEQEFVSKMTEAFDFAEKEEALLTLGLNPSRPDTGYSYIEIDGAQKFNLLKQHKELGLNNLTMLNPIPKEEIFDYIAAIDVALVNLKKSDTLKTVLPS